MPEKHFIEVENGEEVAAVHHEADSDGWIFFCHGFGGNKEGNTGRRTRLVPEHGFNGVCFDFRGNGESNGDFIEQDLSSRVKDLEAVVEYFSPDRFVLFGSSFGGKVVFHAATDLEAEAVTGKAPVTFNEIMDKFRDAVENKGTFEYIEGKPIDERFFQDFDRYSFDDVAEGLDVPVGIFHGGEDTTVHPEHSFRAARELETDVMIQKLEGERHSFSDKAEHKMMNLILRWLESFFR